MATARKHRDSLFWGLILVAVGALLLLENFHFDALRHLARLWPVILIAWGVWKLTLVLTEKKERKPDIPKQGE